MFYPLSFTHEDGDIVVRSKEFPELLTAGETLNESISNAEDALTVVILTYVQKGIDLPSTRTTLDTDEQLVFVPSQVAAKVAVIQAFNDSGISKSELARRLGVAENEARRILDPDYGTKLEKLDAAMRAMGEHLLVQRAA